MVEKVSGRILKRLDEWQQREGCLPECVEFYKSLPEIQTGIKISVPQASLSQNEVNDRLRRGISLLEWHVLSLDWEVVQNLFQEIASVAGDYHKAASADFEKTRDSASKASFGTRVGLCHH